MKKSTLKQIIREEIKLILKEVDYEKDTIKELGDKFQKVVNKYDKNLKYKLDKSLESYKKYGSIGFMFQNPKHSTGKSVDISIGQQTSKNEVVVRSWYSRGWNNAHDTYDKRIKFSDDPLTELHHPKYLKMLDDATKAVSTYISNYSKGYSDYLKAGGRDWH